MVGGMLARQLSRQFISQSQPDAVMQSAISEVHAAAEQLMHVVFGEEMGKQPNPPSPPAAPPEPDAPPGPEPEVPPGPTPPLPETPVPLAPP